MAPTLTVAAVFNRHAQIKICLPKRSFRTTSMPGCQTHRHLLASHS